MATDTLHSETESATQPGTLMERDEALAFAALSRAAWRARSILSIVRWQDPFCMRPDERLALKPGERASLEGIENLLIAALNDLEAALTAKGYENAADAVERTHGASFHD